MMRPLGGSPGLGITGGGSCYSAHEFESQHRILDGRFSRLFVIRIAMFVRKDENKQKEPEDGPFLKKMTRPPLHKVFGIKCAYCW